ncbi:hypothetical protein [endosymbiont of unidentified scaly snail isolate Monju]|uniref:hypothetical protein n=1 Tax=endosymbiont of unidentified scaly snail isolate Monju TaxID=1248727 RepID=UPI0003892659|nr:hypothetical protein [endosymbiont of unidentified scaly snail isolate Monju]BAN70215.1 hypothetical protein EBS_2375 [endosymbiont of unidentified scaly snail isolate Monju]
MARKADSSQENTTSAPADTMQQVRELLFGEYQRQVEARLDKVSSDLERLRQDTEHERSALEQLLAQRIEQLDEQTGTDLEALESSLRNELQTLKTTLEQRIDDLHTLMESELQCFKEETRQQLDQLEAAKVSRKQLAGLMRQLADTLET